MEGDRLREQTVSQEVITAGPTLPAFRIDLILGGDMNSVIVWGLVLDSYIKVFLNQSYSS